MINSFIAIWISEGKEKRHPVTSLRFYETAAVHQEAKLKKREKNFFFRLLAQNVVDLSIFYGTQRPPPDSEKSARHLRSASDGHSGRQYAGRAGHNSGFPAKRRASACTFGPILGA